VCGHPSGLKPALESVDPHVVRRLLSSVVAACLERRSSPLLQRVLCYWIPLAIVALTILLPVGAPVGLLAIPGALFAAASLSHRRASVAVLTATVASVTGPVIALVRSGPSVVDLASAGARIVLVIGLCALVGSLIDLLRRTREAAEEVSRALDLHLYAGFFRLDDSYSETYTGPGVERILGRPLRPDERPEVAWELAVHPDDRLAFDEFFSGDGLSSREFSELEYRIVGNDGRSRWVLDRVHATHAEDGSVEIHGVCLDVTERRRAADELRDARERLTRLAEAVDDVFFELERTPEGDLRARHVNPGIARLLGGAPGQDVFASWRAAIHEDDQPAMREHIAQMRAGEPSEAEYRMVGKDGITRSIWSRVFPHREIDGNLLLVGVLSDISDRTRMAEALEVALTEAERQAATDALTGLANRARLSASLDARLERADTAICTGLLLLDVDRFKRINDTHGHQAGDEVLIELGRRLTAIVGERGLVARLGGEELAVLVTGARHEPGLRELAEEVRAGVGDSPMIVEGLRIPVTVSIGAAQGGENFVTRDSLLSAADRALYAAKRRGRNQVVLVGDLTQKDLEREIPEAVRIAQSLALLASAREGIHEDHCQQVAQLSESVAEELGLANDAVQRCYLGGWLHDIGKASIPDRILGKTGPLDDDEWQLMHAHVGLGENLVVRIDEIASSAPAVRHHHERVDGKGYPDGLIGDAIPIEARVVAAADAYCAIAADRVYARGRDRDAALDELRGNVGSHLDEQVVEALVRVVKRQALQAERRTRVRHPRAA
jgi:diguanylate cyclase (GGDEF)-like protein/putative nucleotidyltransferase with HDIG domain/PAS domain S-box-containing protein